ncbi:MAG TPA: MerR family transcriptional regulator [Hanamia sp.]|nr:MerR family transcriptional regulator [Hanamia sp.]
MNYFSISQLARYSGIKPHTIRMWEQRYNALTPNRSEGNTRYYDNDQLRRLLNIASLLQADYKVSELCKMPDKKLFRLVKELPEKSSASEMNEYFVLQLLGAGMTYNESNFEKIFSHCLLKYGIRDAYTKVLYPLLSRVGLMWTTDALEPAAEHFISNLVRQKLFTAIDALPQAKSGKDSWLMFLPEDEFHEIGLLFAHYLVKRSGRQSVYLGANVPVESLFMAVKEAEPEKLLLFMTHNDLPEETQRLLNELNLLFGKKKIYVAADLTLFENIEVPSNIQWLSSRDDLEQLLPE